MTVAATSASVQQLVDVKGRIANGWRDKRFAGAFVSPRGGKRGVEAGVCSDYLYAYCSVA